MSVNKKANLVLVPHVGTNQKPDIERIGTYIEEHAPEIRVFVVEDLEENLVIDEQLQDAPTTIMAIFPLRHLHKLTGTIFQGSSLNKFLELNLIRKQGLAVPKTTILSETSMPDLSEFGDYVVMKPVRGLQGADVRIVKKNKVKWSQPKTRAASNSKRWIIQEFIYTGKWPVSYRVTSFFGQVLFCIQISADNSRNPLESSKNLKNWSGSIVSSGKGCNFSLCYDEDIISMGEKAHGAFPEVPLIGCDIVRNPINGQLYVIEANIKGYVWHFSSQMGIRSQEYANINYESQFDGIDKAARILIEKTRSVAGYQ